MKCPKCQSTQTAKNGYRRERQCYKCKQCGRQFLESYRPWRYSDEVKQLCIKMYLNGMGLRGIERVTEIHHTTVMHWVREAGNQLRDTPETEDIPEVSDLDELQTFVGSKRNQLWIWTAVNHKQAGILAWVLGDRSAETFKCLWSIVKCWQCFFYVTDGWKVYPMFIHEGDQIVSKTYMGGRRDPCKKRHVVNKYCKQSLIDLLTCPKMISGESNFCTVKPSFHLFLSLTLAHK